ncbi:bifunctional tRNA (5-methylaminomethyl-2-thiouridine)(34)-methyltransferase MnmD/FAD-dependent 5-carboxymethylaminomethyl-2-thiouridine(34) oxidoreductase MnmC [Psychromonas antarctica]|uniref:bifunctional tRNA (5-methylaminomethyl-2-thiouridine)(34)-methyltransferase MnmD/FAD-dependent 5-carboxymethylaminomethyl-2-thiouridine(34) oxidoreductase MnmC n=1 Tax=Psychromonas antarctica TaxID=67573 RepID=UPI001EE83291|nr:bifunctional tRNA (5-methylaminomethyl-2-thiouridine)(34)-methyltransferase MnmD/FAD-dependent 5-carboxymethylaminomethyl-2-thiouridine(34) oxidoreductase MnmC [Psychromonas antarctica]MCG6200582.1 bifunctional tRNA (5-methylaminomethyl-2-thiouridine)(34)-methyltransferase MnmD/FAD-dependent 5-carboxymethylaminomethyl-2-thiouridine(34) oxidoreductase MnmC [Psychromonas antarctica]
MSEDKNKLITHAKINWSDQSEPFSQLFQDVYFNTEQGLNESLYVFIQGNNLAQRWLDCSEPLFTVAETGFGTGLNFLITCLEFQAFQKSHPAAQLQRLHFSSFEKFPLNKQDLQSALNRWPVLDYFIKPLLDQYPLALTGCHRITLNEFNITLDLWLGDVKEMLPALYLYDAGIFDCWYLDGFAPSKNPEMWSEQLFKQIADSCKTDATIATFTAAGFVRRGLINAGFAMQKRKGYGKKREMLIGQFSRADLKVPTYGANYRAAADSPTRDIAIIGGGISSACLALALIKRGFKVTLYCKDASLAHGASGNEQAALYPLLNGHHSALSQFFTNAFLFARNYVLQLAQSNPFAFDFSGLLQLYYDPISAKKLDKILLGQFPTELVVQKSAMQSNSIAHIDIGQRALYYPLAGWLSPKQMVNALFDKAQQSGNLTIHFNHKLNSFSQNPHSWQLNFADKHVDHQLLVLTTGFDTLDFKQCEALPLSAARGQVSHIPTNNTIDKLQVTLCHEGYLTPENNQQHCMGATFKRHTTDQCFSVQEQDDNKQKLAKCIPDKVWVDDIDISGNKANVGIRCSTRDHFPYVGAIPDYRATTTFYPDVQKSPPLANAPFHKNLYMLTGLGSRGLCTAPLLAEMLAAQINHEPLPLSSEILNSLQGNRQWLNYLKKGKPLKF